MEKHTFTYSGGQIIGSISCNPTQVKGRGMVLAPVLFIPISLEMMAVGGSGLKQVGVLFDRLTGKMVVDHAGGFALTLAPCPIRRIIMQGSTAQNVDLEFPIARHQIEAIEQARQSGDVSLSLQLQVEFTLLVQGQAEGPVGVIPPRAVLDTGAAQVFANIKVPQSVWTNAVLTQIGYGQIILFELPALPLTALASLGEALEAAKRAQAQFNAGEYDLCVALCRTAVQPLRSHLKRIKAQAGNDTAADWAEKIGDATFEWLTIVIGKTHGMGSAAAHEGSPGRFTRLDAQMILTTTISILAYSARLEHGVK
jgi:hypothetical protein